MLCPQPQSTAKMASPITCPLNLLSMLSFGDRIAARDANRQTAEIHIRITLMNRFNALGTAEILRVA